MINLDKHCCSICFIQEYLYIYNYIAYTMRNIDEYLYYCTTVNYRTIVTVLL